MAKRKKVGENYKLCWNYLKESKSYFLVVSVLFFVFVLVGFFFPVFFRDLIKRIIEDLMKKTEGMGFFQLLIFILKNNITTAFIGLVSGAILGVFPFLLAVFNGYVLGFVAGKTSSIYGFGVLFRLVPHGIFELPALILSLGLGLKMTRFIFLKEKKEVFEYDFENSLRVFVYVIIPLLVIAGLIEASLIFILG